MRGQGLQCRRRLARRLTRCSELARQLLAARLLCPGFRRRGRRGRALLLALLPQLALLRHHRLQLSEHLGLRKLNEKLADLAMQEFFNGVFPKDSPRNMRSAINFFTQIGLGGLTDSLRAHLADTMKRLAEQRALQAAKEAAGSSSSSSSGSDSDSSSSSDSDSDSDDSDSSSSSSSSSDSESTPPRKKRRRRSRS